MARRLLAWLHARPLLVFVVVGAALFALDAATRGAGGGESRRIDVGEREREWLRGMWATQYNRSPTDSELRALIDDYVREEVLAREAVRIGLDQGDTIVRRRLAQKMSFLIEDTAQVEEPGEEELRAAHAASAARYQSPARWSFQHVYWSAEGSADPSAAARDALAPLRREPESWRRLGDPFMLLREYADRTTSEIGEHFGADFARQLATLTLGAGPASDWQGPLVSAYGAHLVRVTGHRPAAALTFEQARERVRDDVLAESRAAANRAAYEQLRRRYRVVEEPAR